LTAYCPVSLVDESKIVKGDNLYLIIFNENRYVFDSEAKVQRFLKFPKKYIKAQLPVKVPPPTDKVSLAGMAQLEDSIAFLEQSIGQMVTRALLEIGCNRLKYPTLSVRETLLKLFALFLKANNPTNSQYIQAKYKRKMQQFIERCELPVEIYNLSKKKGKSTFLIPKDKKKEKGTWNEFKEKYYNELGAKFDRIVMAIDQEKSENFMNYIR
jgi:adenylate/nucleoside-diphosphate kinase